ncbi:hypothetical protein QFC19_006058 [Naganishia cerealis]|uniref:Uncharacterized protein n=1 Tax=Naganishia cerealis TaxID=610337 RepID=A0ACC2VJ63_9TREE|nr:hypothetical protein QFC19_006058 [Naganishia cerealis]
MKPWSFFLWYLCSVVSATFMEDAFVRDWLKPLVGSVEKFDILSPLSIVAWTDLSQLVKLNVEENNTHVDWRVDLSQKPIVDYKLSPNNQFLVSYDSNGDVDLWETSTGSLIQHHKNAGLVEKNPGFLYETGIITLSGGDLVLLLNNGDRKLIAPGVKDFRFCQQTDLAYIVTNHGDVFTVSADGSTISPSTVGGHDIKYLEIIDMKDGVIATTSEFIKLESETTIAHSFHEKVGLLSNGYFYTAIGSKLEIVKIGSDVPVFTHSFEEDIKNVETKDSVAAFVAVYTATDVHIVVLNDLLITGVSDAVNIQTHSLNKAVKSTISCNDHIWFVEAHTTSPTAIRLASSSQDYTDDKTIILDHYSGRSFLLVDKPQSEGSKILFHSVLNAGDQFVLTSWLLRIKRHLSELGAYLSSFATHSVSPATSETFSRESQFGLGKLLAFYDTQINSVIALESESGKVSWTTSLQRGFGDLITAIDSNDVLYFVFESGVVKFDLNGKILKEETLPLVRSAFKVNGNVFVRFANSKNVKVLELSKDSSQPINYLVEAGKQSITGFEVKDEHLMQTWSHIPKGRIITSLSMPSYHQSASAGIARSDKTILYKYLNRNLVAVLTEVKNQLVLELLDGITGSQVFIQKHDVANIDYTTISLTMADNWIVYSYYVSEPYWEQRITVVDLFDENHSAVAQSAFNSTSAIQASSKTFIYSERIVSLTSTYSKHGITLKSIIALTANGRAVELPKFILNSRRIDDREIKQNDLLDDFRMLAYDPVIPKVGAQVLNHVDKILVTRDTKVLVKDTELESTSVVCVANDFNIFCSTIQPSLSYDVLSSKFDKFKLLVTMAILLVAYLITKPFVASKKLNSQWIEDDI